MHLSNNTKCIKTKSYNSNSPQCTIVTSHIAFPICEGGGKPHVVAVCLAIIVLNYFVHTLVNKKKKPLSKPSFVHLLIKASLLWALYEDKKMITFLGENKNLNWPLHKEKEKTSNLFLKMKSQGLNIVHKVVDTVESADYLSNRQNSPKNKIMLISWRR